MLFTLGIYSCDESTIDLDPIGDTESTYFQNETQMTEAVFGIYHKLSFFYIFAGNQNRPIPAIWMLPSDDMTSLANYATETFSGLNGSTEQVVRFYTYAYQLIARANAVMQKIDENGDFAYKLKPELKDYHRGEALFLRSWTNFLLWNVFGTAPVVTERITLLENAYPPNSNGTELLDQAIIDLQQAAQLLPVSWDAANKGRVTKNSAHGLLGKVLVFRGTVNKTSADFSAAITAFNTLAGLSLMPNYNRNFDIAYENNNESLFEYQANTSVTNVNPFLSSDDFSALGEIGAYDGFFTQKPSWIGNSYFTATSSLRNAYEAGDPRVQYILKPAVPATNINIVKYVLNSGYAAGGLGASYGVSINNPRILRYADILLLKAEAIVRSGGSLPEAIGLINQIRQRARNSTPTGVPAAVPADLNISESNSATILDWIFNERRLELACEEGHRWWDLRRRHIAGETDLKTLNFYSLMPDFQFQDHNVNFPLPESEIVENPNLIQNPGY
jgi:hypothetical protein